jgi:ubiquinone biosynthesis protein
VLEIPALIDELRGFVRDREFSIGMPDVDAMRETIDKVGFRMVFGLVLSAILVSSSLVMLAGAGPTIEGMPLLGLVGFGIGTIMSVTFLFSATLKIFKWRRSKKY